MEEKSEYNKYAAELPIVKGKLRLPTGFLESEELWLKLEEVFFPTQTITDFNKLPIPFRCVATDLANGKATVFSSGSLYRCIRASMAIPGVFSTVEINGRTYVDGGVVRNFPVKDVLAMGADYALGVSVSAPLKNVKELDNAAKILTQVVFLGESIDRNEENKLCNKFFEVPLDNYSSGDFAKALEIIDLGIAFGRSIYPQLKALADSLNAIYPNAPKRFHELQLAPFYKIDEIVVEGLAPREKEYFLRQINLEAKTDSLTADQITEAIRNAYAFNMYESITYDVIKNEDNTTTLQFQAIKDPMFVVKGGLNYNSFTGFMLQGNITARNWLAPYSRSMLSLAAGDNFRGMVEHLQLLGSGSAWSYKTSVYGEHQELNEFENSRIRSVYNFRYYSWDNLFLNSRRRKWSAGLGARYDYIIAKPRTFSDFYVEGNNRYWNIYLAGAYNSFARPFYPDKGQKVDFQLAYVAGAAPKFKIFDNGNLIGDETTIPLVTENFLQAKFEATQLLPLSKKLALETKLQSNINFTNEATLLNTFYIGGVTKTFRNQMTFVGAREAQFSAESAAIAGASLRYNLTGELYFTTTYNLLAKDFYRNNINYVNGFGVTASYFMLLGPLEFTMMYNDKVGGLYTYINLGFPFK